MSSSLPNVLIVGDSISHGYFPVLRARLKSAALQHAPSNTGALPAGVACWNISTALGTTGSLPKPWDLVVFNFGLHDTSEPTPPPLGKGCDRGRGKPALAEHNYMALLRRYTSLVQHSGRVRRGLWASTTPYMAKDVWRTVEVMNRNASAYMASVGVPTVDLFAPIVRHCAPSGKLPYASCDICSGSTPGHPVAANSTPHYTTAGYELLVDALVPAIKAALSKPALKSEDNAMLFFDGGRLASWTGLNLSLGRAHLLSEYHDPTSYTGWGFPSVWRKADGSGWRMMYQGRHLKDGGWNAQLALLADSRDGVTWAPARARSPAFNVSNCVLWDNVSTFSFVYDDGAHAGVKNANRLKCLRGDDTIIASEDGESWHHFGRWTSAPIDPGFSVYRNPLDPDELVVTARPQALRWASGRHAGYHAAAGWSGLAKESNERAWPLDSLFRVTSQAYGLASFSYHTNVVSWFWRYSCPQVCPWGTGHVSSALAYSYNSRNWTAFGQFPFPEDSAENSSPPPVATTALGRIVERGPLNNTNLGGESYGHSYTVFRNKTEGALSCQAECDADKACGAWTYVVGGECCGKERCCRHKELGCPGRAVGCVSGAKKAGPCNAHPGPTPAPPSPPAQRLPELFPNVDGTPSAGQVRPPFFLPFTLCTCCC